MHVKLRSIGTIAISATLFIGAFANAANASPKLDDDQATYTMCVITLAPEPLTDAASRVNLADSRVASQTCAERSAQEGNLPSAAGQVPIIEFYQHPNYQGKRYRIDAPRPCSSPNGGWSIFNTRPLDLGYGAWGISSWRAYSQCWHTTIYHDRNLRGDSWSYAQGTWRAGSIGSGFNDHVFSVRTEYS
jgi:hypothetical protein